MQAPQGTLNSVQVLYNSAVNAALLLMRSYFDPNYDPNLHACYLAPPAVGPPVDVDMDTFISTQTDGDSSEGWTTAFLLDLMDFVNENNNGGQDGSAGSVDHGDYVCIAKLIFILKKLLVIWVSSCNTYINIPM